MPVTKGRPLLAVAALAALVAVIVIGAVEPAAAQAGPFGVAAPEAGGGVATSGLFAWVAARQNDFYRALTAGLRAMRADPHAGAWNVAGSIADGVCHAAGPGHGKAVITSYVLANRETLRRGILLSFVSALVQGTVAIVLVGLSVTVFRLTALEMTDATMVIERTSAAAIFALGLWLVWSKVIGPVLATRRAARSVPAVASEDGVVDISIGGAGASASAATACGCGTIHAPDPSMLRGKMDLKRAIAAVAAVGIRPCTGALIVLVFAFAQRLPFAGVLSVLAMAIGTGVTVAVLASIAVSARSVALRFAGDDGPWAFRVMRGAEILGALIVLTMGVLLAGASLWGGPIAAG